MDHIFAFSHVQSRYLALGPRFGLVLVGQLEGFTSRRSFWTDFRYFVILGGAGDINNSISTANYCNGPYIRLFPCAIKVFSAWTEVWSGTCRPSRRFSFPEVAIWTIFVILGEGEAGDINNSISTANYCNGPYICLLPCACKVFSAWTEVWSGTCRPSRRFCFPRVVLGRFLRF